MKKLLRLLAFACCAGAMFIACSDDKEPAPEVIPEISFTEKPYADRNMITYRWNTIPDIVFYTLEYSTDEQFSSVTIKTETTQQQTLTLTGLQYSTRYYARVRALLASGQVTDWDYAEGTLTQSQIPVPEDLLSLDDINRTEVRFRISAGDDPQYAGVEFGFTSLAIYTVAENGRAKELLVTFPLSAADAALGYYTIEAGILDEFTDYYAFLYGTVNGYEHEFNSVQFSTWGIVIPEKILRIDEQGVDGTEVTFRFYIDPLEWEDDGTEFIFTTLSVYYSSNGELAHTFTLSDTDRAEGYLTVEAKTFDELTAYRAVLSGTADGVPYDFNEVSFTTEENPVDDDWDGPEIRIDSEIALARVIAYINESETPRDVTILLKAGYRSSLGGNVSLKAGNVTIKSEDPDSRAAVVFDGAITLSALSGIKTLTIDGIDFTSENNSVLLNLQDAGIERVTLNDCKFTEFSYGVTTGSGGYPQELIVENCIMTWTDASVPSSSHAIFHGSATSDNVCYIRTKNCSIINMPFGFVYGANNGNGPKFDLDVINCTIIGLDRVPNPWFRFRKQEFFHFYNNIIAKYPGYNDSSSIRPFITIPDLKENNYRANDQYNGNGYGFTLNGVVILSYQSTEIFPKLLQEDYSISPSVMTSDYKPVNELGIGDARWFPDGVTEAEKPE